MSRRNLILRNTEAATAEQVYRRALRLLTGRDYTVAGMRRKLAAGEIAGQECDEAIGRLEHEGWLDDRRYAARFAEAALSAGRYFGTRLRMEMRRRGFPADIVNEVLEHLLMECDEIAEVRLAVERRHSGFSYSAASDRDRRRMVGFLQRRGFGLSTILDALRKDG